MWQFSFYCVTKNPPTKKQKTTTENKPTKNTLKNATHTLSSISTLGKEWIATRNCFLYKFIQYSQGMGEDIIYKNSLIHG